MCRRTDEDVSKTHREIMTRFYQMEFELLKPRLLDAPLIIKNYVKKYKNSKKEPDPKCNYEIYLVELLNRSEKMKELHPQEFILQEKQSHAECDAYSGNYGIDFKLFASQSRMKASSNLSPQYVVDKNGVKTAYESKSDVLNRAKEMTATNLHIAVGQTSLEELEHIRISKNLNDIEIDIKAFLKTLETEKNLLLFYPYEFRFKDYKHPDHGVNIILETLQKSFQSAIMYRKKVQPEFETYLTTLYYNDFILARVNNQKLELMDVIEGNSCPTFEYLRGFEWPPWSIINYQNRSK